VHLLHVTFTLPVGRHPSRLLFDLAAVVMLQIFSREGTARPTLVLRNLITGMSFFWPFVTLLWL
jgi:hypothetical protein